MKKIIAAVAILGAFAAPVAPVQAASTTAADIIDSCWVLPLLKAECWPTAEDKPILVTTAATSTEKALSWPVPAWWNCTPAPEGSKYLLDCE